MTTAVNRWSDEVDEVDEVDEPGSPPPAAVSHWHTIDVATLATDPDDTPPVDDSYAWTLDRILEPQTRAILAGDEGGGKSLLLMQLMVALAAGRAPYTGAAPQPPRRVLVIDTELHERTVRRRLGPMARHANLQPGWLTYVLAPAGIDLVTDPADRHQFATLIDTTSPHVVAVDSLYRAFNGDPDDPAVIGRLQRLFDQTRDRTGAAIILTAHYRKRGGEKGPASLRSLDDIAGSRLMKAWPEIVLDVAKDTVRILKDREGLAPELTLERHSTGTWEQLDDGWPYTLADPAAVQTIDPANTRTWTGHTVVQAELRELLATSDALMSSNQVVTALKDRRALDGQKGRRKDTVLAALGELRDLHHVLAVPGDRGALLWSITPEGLIANSTTAPVPDPWEPVGNQSEPVPSSDPTTGSQTALLPLRGSALGEPVGTPVPNHPEPHGGTDD